jgi:hypothetical protein
LLFIYFITNNRVEASPVGQKKPRDSSHFALKEQRRNSLPPSEWELKKGEHEGGEEERLSGALDRINGNDPKNEDDPREVPVLH